MTAQEAEHRLLMEDCTCIDGHGPVCIQKIIDWAQEEVRGTKQPAPKPYQATLIPLRGPDCTPAVVLNRTLDKLDHLEAVIVILQWKKDGAFACDWSKLQASDLLMAATILDNAARCVVLDRRQDGEWMT